MNSHHRAVRGESVDVEIKDKIREFIRNQLQETNPEAATGDLADDMRLIEEGILDSLMILSLLAFLEENFGVVLSEGEMRPSSFKSIQSIRDLVVSKIGA